LVVGHPFYLDSLENDPLAFVDADGVSLEGTGQSVGSFAPICRR